MAFLVLLLNSCVTVSTSSRLVITRGVIRIISSVLEMDFVSLPNKKPIMGMRLNSGTPEVPPDFVSLISPRCRFLFRVIYHKYLCRPLQLSSPWTGFPHHKIFQLLRKYPPSCRQIFLCQIHRQVSTNQS